ncbi:unnamed protein product [Angiostrongylus costaricensis]|uniref:ShTK domain protein n=1 Tax=Angiostrongylus costaricensis TaxID=334426 RepID=A0A158PD03_ANGCS|nr:unnamed protein product [Angiostrongylus costaricensis]
MLLISILASSLLMMVVAVVNNAKVERDPCASAPTESAKIICGQLHRWDEMARQAFKKKSALPPGAAATLPAELAPIASSIYQCMDLQCMCSYMRGDWLLLQQRRYHSYEQLSSFRKEIRMMTDDERQRYYSAIRMMKQNGEYDRVARMHTRSTVMGGAHSGPAFLPWHREYIKRLEFAIRQIDPTLALPYWDSTLEEALARPADSVMFSSDIGGSTNRQGFVNSGPFTQWQTLEGKPNIKREVGAKGGPMKQEEIDFVMRQSEVDQVLNTSVMCCKNELQGCPYRTDYNCLEYTHGNVHIFVGGDMFDTSTSANDPLFFLHHAFVDLIWEQWRQRRQSRAERERVYPPDNQLCASPQHFAAAQMNPFPPMRNIDGLSNKYTDNLYEYAPRPTCSEAYPDCGSKYLFCDQSHGQARCAAKIRLGAACDGYVRGENPCFNGACVAGRCTVSSGLPVSPTYSSPVLSFQETCFNENECCTLWAERGECTVNAPYMSFWCKASCRQCTPQYPLIDDCSDRHHNCGQWARSGECTINSLWMSENCRRSCGRCHQTRYQACQPTTTQKPNEVCNTTKECYNENICCPHWSLQGECTKLQTWMACNCRVSCGYCVPQNYNYGSCLDYHPECQGWARLGECERNPWMLENCRFSCQSCYSHWNLREICGVPAGKISALRSYCMFFINQCAECATARNKPTRNGIERTLSSSFDPVDG